jgi:hypothetical protein
VSGSGCQPPRRDQTPRYIEVPDGRDAEFEPHQPVSWRRGVYVAVCLTCICPQTWATDIRLPLPAPSGAFRDLCSARRIKVVRLFLRHSCGSSGGPAGHRRLPGPRHTYHLSGSREVGKYSLFWLSVAATLQSEPAERIGRIERPRYFWSRKVRRRSLAGEPRRRSTNPTLRGSVRLAR